ncbi:MAG: CBS domain-containing protein [Planctomycetota bacterium]
METARDILERKGRDVATIESSAWVLQAAKKMNERHIGALVVVDGEQVVGMFTERDILNRVVAEQRDAATTRVAEVMTTPVACCRLSTPLSEIQGVMTEKRLRHLPIVEDGKLLGMISSGDVLASQVTIQQTTIEYLNAYLYGRR